MPTPFAELRDISKRFGSLVALDRVSLSVYRGEVLCLLGDNGAGKSTLIKILSGVYSPDDGSIWIRGNVAVFRSPRDAISSGIATVYQDLALLPLMSITRNFFLGNEPVRRLGPVRLLDRSRANEIVTRQLRGLGIELRDPEQPVGTLSGGERQSIAAARAVYLGAQLLILDEPTSALGVKEVGLVLRNVKAAARRGTAVILITHNVQHALAVGDRFCILERGRVSDTFKRGERSLAEVLTLMSGGLDALQQELQEIATVGAAEPAEDSRFEDA